MSSVERQNYNRLSHHHNFLIKLRGIPNSVTKDDVKKFLYPCRIVSIYLFDNKDKSSSECMIDLESEADVRKALEKSDQYMGNRCIEVFSSTNSEYKFFMKYKGSISWRDPVIRVNGLPGSCTMADVQLFFKDIEIARNGIYITRDMSDNAVGNGYVAFVSMDNAYKAIDIYDQQYLKRSRIDLIPSTYDEAKKSITDDAYVNGKQFCGADDQAKKMNICNENKKRTRSHERSRSNSCDQHYRAVKRRRSTLTSPRSRTYQNNRQRKSRSPIHCSSSKQTGEYLIKMRGMPYTVVESDIRQFFPSNCQPVRIEIIQDRRLKRPNGDGHVYFNTKEDAIEAMKCDRKYMNNRYIELYCDSVRYSLSNYRRRSHSNSPLLRSKTKTNH
ncbi:unnamed protein product [Adineta ricciae]|uniref:RRM domain-containing protein n=1 Tax=Adineta ricciae TaxID=249248 RepID=A0A813YZS5_ADIRI|nr:unnamed protein product [Adineta ricciae]